MLKSSGLVIAGHIECMLQSARFRLRKFREPVEGVRALYVSSSVFRLKPAGRNCWCAMAAFGNRILPGGRLLTQQVGSEDCAGLDEALEAPAAYRTTWNADAAVEALNSAGLTVLDVRQEWPSFTFYDIGALVYQLRAVPWQV